MHRNHEKYRDVRDARQSACVLANRDGSAKAVLLSTYGALSIVGATDKAILARGNRVLFVAHPQFA